MTGKGFDRGAEDLGNIVNFGHVNHRVPDQRLATIFYIMGLGLTRDPAMMTGVDNMWVNTGVSQFHLPTGPAVVAPGIVTGLVVPDLADLRRRLERIRSQLAQTRFDVREIDGAIETVCPWGNRIRCHEPRGARFDPRGLGIAYVAFEVPRGRARAIARFYREAMRALVTVEPSLDGEEARVVVGHRQWLIFTECATPAPACPDHHIQIYLADFSSPYHALKALGVQVEESNRYQYRFKTIPDVVAAEPVFILDHEVRSMTHPMYNRPLINRNPAQTTADYLAGGDFYAPNHQ
jgi:hypothetical protein